MMVLCAKTVIYKLNGLWIYLYQVYAWFDSNWLLYYEVDTASLGKCEQDLEIYIGIIFAFS